MQHSDFRLGETFWCGERVWRCTDIGARTIIAIRIDSVELEMSSGDPSQAHTLQTLNHAEAEAEGLFIGPPYKIAESVFDEYDIQGCSLEHEDDDSAPWEPTAEERKLMDVRLAKAISGPYLESRKIFRSRSEASRAAKLAAMEQAGDLEQSALLKAKARPQDLLDVVKCGSGHMMRAKNYDVHRSTCGRRNLLPVTPEDMVELEMLEADRRVRTR